MRLWPFGSRVERKDSATAVAVWMQSLGRAVWTPRQYDKLAQEAYMQNAIAYRCVRMIAEAAAGVPLLVFEGEKEVDEHPLLKVLKRPNASEGGVELFERFFSFGQLSGNGYLEAVLLDGEVRELFALRPDRMKVIPGRTGYPAAYEYTVGQYKTTFPITPRQQNPIMHQKMFHPLSDHYGMSPVEAAAFAIDVHNQAANFNKSLLDNQARPSGALMYGKNSEGKSRTMSDEQWGRMKQELEDKYTGSSNAGRPLILEGDFDWKEMGTTMRDMEFQKGKEAAAREIALSFGVPPMILGIPGDATYANYKEANVAFFRQTVLPLLDKTVAALTNFFAPTYGEAFRVEYNSDEIPALALEREAVWDKVKDADFISYNEKREAVGYEKLEGEEYDDVHVSAAKIPVGTPAFTPGGAAPNVPPKVDPNVDPKTGKPKK